MKAVYLIPQGSYQTRLRSDTLWGVLCWGIRTLYGQEVLEDMLRRAEAGDPEFVISSTFPFYTETDETGRKITHRLYPLPLNLSAQEDATYTNKEEYRQRKKIKEIRFLTETDFKAAIAGRLQKSDLLNTGSAKVNARTESTIATHNTIDRINLATLQKKTKGSEIYVGQLFHNEEFSVDVKKLREQSKAKITEKGLFFLVRGNSEKIEAVLRYFRHRGIGANSSAGKGTFASRTEDLPEFGTPSDANALVNLSLFKPRDNEAFLYQNRPEDNAYLLVNRGGKIGQHLVNQDKPKVPCFKEGSVLYGGANKSLETVFGQVIEEKKEHENIISHSVYRNFLGFMVKMKG